MSNNLQDPKENEKFLAAMAAVQLVKNNDVVGLGTGSTASFAIHELAKRMQEGLKIQGVGSSLKTEAMAKSLGIPLLALGEVNAIDISIDGADEFTESLCLIKGGGGALFREKIMASLSKNQIIITDSSKKVDRLGAFKVPIEVVPTAYRYVLNQIEKLNGKAILRHTVNTIFITDNHNYIVDVDFGLIDEPEKLAQSLNQIEGVLAHGLFINLTTKIIMAKEGALISYSKA